MRCRPRTCRLEGEGFITRKPITQGGRGATRKPAAQRGGGGTRKTVTQNAEGGVTMKPYAQRGGGYKEICQLERERRSFVKQPAAQGEVKRKLAAQRRRRRIIRRRPCLGPKVNINSFTLLITQYGYTILLLTVVIRSINITIIVRRGPTSCTNSAKREST